MGRRLYRSSTERVFAGVAGGVAEYFDLDPALVRVAWALLILASGGIFFLLYIVMWFVVPEAPPGVLSGDPWPSAASMPADAGTPGAGETPADQGEGAPAPGAAPVPPMSPGHEWAARRRERRHRSGSGALVVGSVLVLVGAWFLAREWIPALNTDLIWPWFVILLGLVLLFSALRSRSD
jgi:phage shock protein C